MWEMKITHITCMFLLICLPWSHDKTSESVFKKSVCFQIPVGQKSSRIKTNYMSTCVYSQVRQCPSVLGLCSCTLQVHPKIYMKKKTDPIK